MTTRGLLDTSVYIAAETGRSLDTAAIPRDVFASVVTFAELHAGVLSATDTETRHRRLATLQSARVQRPLPVTAEAAEHWARLRVRLAESGRRMKANDLWIASVALAHDLPVVTQDGDFDVLAELDLLAVVRV